MWRSGTGPVQDGIGRVGNVVDKSGSLVENGTSSPPSSTTPWWTGLFHRSVNSLSTSFPQGYPQWGGRASPRGCLAGGRRAASEAWRGSGSACRRAALERGPRGPVVGVRYGAGHARLARALAGGAPALRRGRAARGRRRPRPRPRGRLRPAPVVPSDRGARRRGAGGAAAFRGATHRARRRPARGASRRRAADRGEGAGVRGARGGAAAPRSRRRPSRGRRSSAVISCARTATATGPRTTS